LLEVQEATPPGGFKHEALALYYGRAPTTVANVVLRVVPSVVTEPTITTAMSPAIRPYSIAVTPRSSLINARRLLMNLNIPGRPGWFGLRHRGAAREPE
jgi:hypothetical protein